MAEDSQYLCKIQEVLRQYPNRVLEGPTEILPHLYIGGYKNAKDVDRLREIGITHVVNCAAINDKWPVMYDKSSGIRGYLAFQADDCENYNILQHVADAAAFIDQCENQGGKALVHCAMGVNRSGAICVAYVMLRLHVDVVTAVGLVKEKRALVLCNQSFQRQIVQYARDHDLLAPRKIQYHVFKPFMEG